MVTHYIQFPSKIITATLGIPENYKKQCIQEAYKIGDKQFQKTNVKAIMSSYAVWEETNIYGPLLDKIMEKVNTLFPINDKRFKYDLINAWMNIYKEGNYTESHNHSPSQYSFSYYLQTSKNSTPLIFDNCDFEINPQEDLLILFPSYIDHSVPIHKGKDRICLSGNIIFTSTKKD